MQRINPPTTLACALLCFAMLAPSVSAQLGPNTAQIPSAAQGTNQDTDRSTGQDRGHDARSEPSMSEAVRPAIDEILIAKARSARPEHQDGDAQSQAITPQIDAGRVPTGALPAPSGDNAGSDGDGLRRSTASLPIGPPPGAQRSALAGAPGEGQDAGARGLGEGWLQTLIALSGVVLLILGLGQLYKRLARSQGGLVGQLGAGGSAPSGILEVIGRYPIAKGMTLVVMKFDQRILLVSHASSSGRGKFGARGSMQTLCELSDPEEVASVLLKARSASGQTIAQSFERALRDADSITDEYMHEYDPHQSQSDRVRFPSQRRQPARTITNDEGDRAELWSSGQDSRAAAGVLRQRLSSMRKGNQG